MRKLCSVGLFRDLSSFYDVGPPSIGSSYYPDSSFWEEERKSIKKNTCYPVKTPGLEVVEAISTHLQLSKFSHISLT